VRRVDGERGGDGGLGPRWGEEERDGLGEEAGERWMRRVSCLSDADLPVPQGPFRAEHPFPLLESQAASHAPASPPSSIPVCASQPHLSGFPGVAALPFPGVAVGGCVAVCVADVCDFEPGPQSFCNASAHCTAPPTATPAPKLFCTPAPTPIMHAPTRKRQQKAAPRFSSSVISCALKACTMAAQRRRVADWCAGVSISKDCGGGGLCGECGVRGGDCSLVGSPAGAISEMVIAWWVGGLEGRDGRPAMASAGVALRNLSVPGRRGLEGVYGNLAASSSTGLISE